MYILGKAAAQFCTCQSSTFFIKIWKFFTKLDIGKLMYARISLANLGTRDEEHKKVCVLVRIPQSKVLTRGLPSLFNPFV
jgi:hypothetical protein